MTAHLSTHIPYVPVPLDPLPNDAEALGAGFQHYLSYHLGRSRAARPSTCIMRCPTPCVTA